MPGLVGLRLKQPSMARLQGHGSGRVRVDQGRHLPEQVHGVGGIGADRGRHLSERVTPPGMAYALPIRAQADVAFDDAALLVAVAAQFARVIGHGIGADGAVEAPDHTYAGFQCT